MIIKNHHQSHTFAFSEHNIHLSINECLNESTIKDSREEKPLSNCLSLILWRKEYVIVFLFTLFTLGDDLKRKRELNTSLANYYFLMMKADFCSLCKINLI